MVVNDRDDKIAFSIETVNKLVDGNRYKVQIAIPMEYGWIDSVNFVVEKDWETFYYPLSHQKNEDGFAYFESEIDLNTSALYRYYFQTYCNGELRLVKRENVVVSYYEELYEQGERKLVKREELLDNQAIVQDEMWKMSVHFEVPRWAQGKMMYHIFLDRFYRGNKEPMQEMPRRHIHHSWDEPVSVGPDEDGIWNNDFFGGDLQGITEKLDYLVSLGIKILYISPIVFSPSTHRYDSSDYEIIDPYAGRKEDLKRLCDEAHKRGMRVVLDAVFNHTGSDSKYFNKYRNPEWEEKDGIGAYYSDDAKYANFYYKKYNEQTGKWEFSYWWDIETMPKCNGYSKEWQDYIVGKGGIIDQWFALGIDGLRLDVADELTDDFIEKIRIAVKRNKADGFILGEVWENPMTKDNRGYMKSGKGMDAVMNYHFVSSLLKYFRYGDVTELAQKIREIRNGYPDGAIYAGMNFTSTHDMTRGINLWDDSLFGGRWPWDLKNEDHQFCQQYKMSLEQYEKAKQIYMAYVFCLTFMPGILSIFYGDEVGLQGIGNLDNRKPFPWEKEDKELLAFFQMIGGIRNQESFMEDAELKVHDINYNYIAFERMKQEERVFVVVNRTPIAQQFFVPDDYQETMGIYTLKKSRVGIVAPYGGIAMKYGGTR